MERETKMQSDCRSHLPLFSMNDEEDVNRRGTRLERRRLILVFYH